MSLDERPSDAELAECARLGISLQKLRERLRTQLDRNQQARALLTGRPPASAVTPTYTLPAPAEIRLVLPFGILCPDNRKWSVREGQLWLSRRYRDAKKAIRAEAQRQYRGPLLHVPVALVALVWFPGEDGDAPNLAKCTHDALAKAIYRRDALVHDARWVRAGVDPVHPRAELTITILPSAEACRIRQGTA